MLCLCDVVADPTTFKHIYNGHNERENYPPQRIDYVL